MDFGSEKALAHYVFTEFLAAVANSELDPLMTLVEMRKLVDIEIDAELDRWSGSLEADDE